MRTLASALFICLVSLPVVCAVTVQPAMTVQNVTLSSGHLRVTIPSGTAAMLKNGEEIVGVFVEGNGTFAYVSTDPIEFAVAKTNLKFARSKATATGDEMSLTISGNVAEVAWYGKELPQLTGAVAGSLEQAFAAHQTITAQTHGRSAEYLLNEQRLIAPAAKAVHAELRGDEEWVYRFDDVDGHAESLERLMTLNFDDRSRRNERFASLISEVPIGRDRRQSPQPIAVMTRVDYSITDDGGTSSKTIVKEMLVPRVSGVRAIPFTLMDAIYMVDGRPPHRVKVVSVSVDGAKSNFIREEDNLLVPLPAETAAGKPIAIETELGGDFLIHPGGDNYWSLRTDDWLPMVPESGRAFTVHGVVRTKAPFIAFAGGRTIVRNQEGDYNVLETAIDQPIDFVSVVAGRYYFDEEKHGDLAIRIASYGQKNTRAIKQITSLAFNMIQYYEYFLGPFPFPELNIVQIDSLGWGQSPAGIVYITSEAFEPSMGVNRYFTEGINERLAHEIAHQWWGTAVRIPTREEEWLRESFAEYSAALLLKKFQGDGSYNRLVAHWKTWAHDASPTGTMPLANRFMAPSSNDDFVNRFGLLYCKGPYLLSVLNKQLGDETFLTFMKSYQKSFHNKPGTTKDVAGLLGFMTKKDFKPFFESYYYGTALP